MRFNMYVMYTYYVLQIFQVTVCSTYCETIFCFVLIFVYVLYCIFMFVLVCNKPTSVELKIGNSCWQRTDIGLLRRMFFVYICLNLYEKQTDELRKYVRYARNLRIIVYTPKEEQPHSHVLVLENKQDGTIVDLTLIRLEILVFSLLNILLYDFTSNICI